MYKFIRLVEKLAQKIKYKLFLIRFKSSLKKDKFIPMSNTQKNMVERLTYAIQNDIEYIIPNANWLGFRGSGKTFVMMYLSQKYGYKIIVDSLNDQARIAIDSGRYGFKNVSCRCIDSLTNDRLRIGDEKTFLIDIYRKDNYEKVMNIKKSIPNVKFIGFAPDMNFEMNRCEE